MAFNFISKIKDILSADKALTLDDLRQIDAGRIARSEDIDIQKRERFIVNENPSVFKKLLRFITRKPVVITSCVMKYSVYNRKEKTHYEVILKCPLHIDKNSVLNQFVQIYCSCPDFKYRAAWLLNSKGNLFLNDRIRNALGIAVDTQPMKVRPTIACKHCYACIKDFVRRYEQYLIVGKK